MRALPFLCSVTAAICAVLTQPQSFLTPPALLPNELIQETSEFGLHVSNAVLFKQMKMNQLECVIFSPDRWHRHSKILLIWMRQDKATSLWAGYRTSLCMSMLKHSFNIDAVKSRGFWQRTLDYLISQGHIRYHFFRFCEEIVWDELGFGGECACGAVRGAEAAPPAQHSSSFTISKVSPQSSTDEVKTKANLPFK